VFKVIQHEQQVLLAQRELDLLEDRALADLLKPKRLGNRRWDQVRVADGGQPDKADAIGEVVTHLCRDLQG
jgi:hypothetical protein